MVNKSVTVFVGEPVLTLEDIRVTIDCGQLIDEVVITSGITNPTVTWFKNRDILTTGSAVNVEISDDGRFCVITDTLLAVDGTYGNYSCEVCSTPTDCNISTSYTGICGE